MKELDNISQEKFQKSRENVIIEIPSSHLVHKPTSAEIKKEKRKMEKRLKKLLQKKKKSKLVILFCKIV